MILVTGATGNIGSSLLRELRAHDAGSVRALTRDVATARFPAGVEAVEGDLADVSSLKSALAGVHSLFLVPRLGPDAEILDAARRAGVEHVVLVSSITVHTHPHLGPAADNAATEKLLEASGMAWTILRPTQFASNALLWAPTIQAHHPIELPYPDASLPTIHPADIASVARVALAEPGHTGTHYALTGPEPLSARDQLATIATLLGRDIPITEITRERARPTTAALFGEEAADAVLDITGGDLNPEIQRVRATVPRLTGEPGRTFRQWAAENVTAFE
ncbi:capsule biosynthesis protein CapD [Nocardia mangyaensis]|uniref:Capsule biosynthesis protein CapD n=1 Tax=Nocardia mangyaensis TaxID=2213200 RepID=A0A1J0VZ15_9NOCA|nr:NAD(P)H-binding protein [Nocardia mangyaensis]APE37344.1 capsule biosynthesis protein CapD [Nocardia mangyaensis]